MSFLRICFGIALVVTAELSPTSAETVPTAPLPMPEGPVILTVGGKISVTNEEDKAKFDLAMLEELGVTRITTHTPWTAEKMVFDVVTMKSLMERVGATGELIFAEAVNDYNAELPISDATDDGAFIAIRADGREMSMRERGPLWVVFDYDADPKFRAEVYYTRSIWQLDRITLRDAPKEPQH